MSNNAQNVAANHFKEASMNADDAINDIAGLLSAGLFLMNIERHHSVGLELIIIAHDYAREVSKGGDHG